MSALQHIAKAADKLSQNPEWRASLGVFVDMWGLDAYTPPELTERLVREIVIAFLIAADEAKPLNPDEGKNHV